jgi:biotin transport system substrate-specific component
MSMTLYVAVGLVGVPWYAGGVSGYDAAKVTFGYLVGFVIAAAVVGWLSERGQDRQFVSSLGQMMIGSVIIYAVGVPVLMHALDVGLAKGLEFGLRPFVVTDVLKALAAAGLLPLAWKLVGRSRES